MGVAPHSSRRRQLTWLAVLAVLLFGPATVRCAMAPIRVSTPLTVGFAPLDLTVTVVVPRSDANREVCVFVSLEGETQESCWTLNGSNERVEWQRKFKRLPPGDYAIIGVLRRSGDVVYSRPVKVRSISGS